MNIGFGLVCLENRCFLHALAENSPPGLMGLEMAAMGWPPLGGPGGPAHPVVPPAGGHHGGQHADPDEEDMVDHFLMFE